MAPKRPLPCVPHGTVRLESDLNARSESAYCISTDQHAIGDHCPTANRYSLIGLIEPFSRLPVGAADNRRGVFQDLPIHTEVNLPADKPIIYIGVEVGRTGVEQLPCLRRLQR